MRMTVSPTKPQMMSKNKNAKEKPWGVGRIGGIKSISTMRIFVELALIVPQCRLGR